MDLVDLEVGGLDDEDGLVVMAGLCPPDFEELCSDMSRVW